MGALQPPHTITPFAMALNTALHFALAFSVKVPTYVELT